jgi:hypothetical protein
MTDYDKVFITFYEILSEVNNYKIVNTSRLQLYLLRKKLIYMIIWKKIVIYNYSYDFVVLLS